jgi:hypothetical protein
MERYIEYQALATRFRSWWYVEVPMLHVLAECRFLSEVESVARRGIATSLGIEADAFEVVVELQQSFDDYCGNTLGSL